MNIRSKWSAKEYRLIKLLGEGNCGKVYKAIDSSGSILAIKVSKDILSITNEYNAMIRLRNMPFVPKIYDFDDWENGDEVLHFIVMDYIQGENLKEMGNSKRLNSRTVFKIGQVLINILREIDKLGYKYTDIKLENIIVDEKGKIHFVDFGSLVEKAKPTKEYTPPYNINSWNVKFSYNYEMSILFSVTMVMIALIGKKEYNPLVYNLEQVICKVHDFPLKLHEKQFLARGLKGKFRTFDEYNSSLFLLIDEKRCYNDLSKIDYLLIISIVSFVFVVIIGIKVIFY